jgi:signal transduction histidine kinase
MMQKNRIKVLLIEDDPLHQRLFSEYLKGTEYAGSEIISTDAIFEAERLSTEYQFDIVVSDLDISDAHHTECIDHLLRLFSDKPILLLTGTGNTELARTAVGSGIQAYLEKDMLSASSLNFSLLHALEQFKLTQSLRYTIRNLHAKNRINEQITSTISHDFRSPVGSMLGLLQLMAQDPDNQEVYQQKAIESGNHLLQSMEDMLDLMNRPSEKEIDTEKISLEACLSSVMMRLDRGIYESDARITTDFSRASHIQYSNAYLQSYLQNLLSNAIKYRRHGIATEIRVSSEPYKDYIRISVADNGTGIDLTKHGEKVFGFKERFHNCVPGTGLGLFNIKNQIESLGGKIEVSSVPGEGSTFSLYLRELKTG